MPWDELDVVVLWQVEEPWESRLAAQLGPVTALVHAAGMSDVHSHLQQYPRAVVVGMSAAVRAEEQFATARSIASAARDHADRMIAVLGIGPKRLDENSIFELASAGISRIFHMADGGPTGVAPLVAWLRALRPQQLPVLVWAALDTPVDARAETLYKVALRLSVRPYTIEALALACGCSTRTLHRLCRAAHVGSPQRLKAMSRLLTVGYLMDRPGARLDEVSLQLGFDSIDALRLKLARWTGRNTSYLTRHGWLATLRRTLLVLGAG